MAFKMKGMSFGEGTGYKSPQLMKKEAAMKMKREAAMKLKKDSAMDLNYDSAMKMKEKMRDKDVGRVAKVREASEGKGRTVTKTKTRKIDGATVTKSKGPGYKDKSVMKMIEKERKEKREMRKKTRIKEKSPMKKEEKMYGGDKTYSEAQKQSKGNMSDTIKKQRAYEKKKKAENPDWNKRDDNAWKARQNKINEYAGSKKRYDVKTGKQEDGGKVKQSNTTNIKGEDRSKTVIKSPTGDKSKVVETKNKEGNITSQKTVDKTVAGTEKLKKKYDEDGNLIRVRGYVTGDKDKRKAAKDEKKKMKEEAKKNRKQNRKDNRNKA